MEAIYIYEANLIADIQEQSPGSDEIYNSITQAMEPVYAFSILFPFLAGLNVALATDILVVSASTEWLTMILKWLLREDRPFWWVHETPIMAPSLSQTTLTCSTSFGSPSEHVALAAGVGYALAASSSGARGGRAMLVWSSLAMATALATMARLVAAASFPHQCLLGAILGVGVSWLTLSPPLRECWLRAGRLALLVTSIAAVLAVLAAYWIQRGAGMDPQASVKLAFKWCEQPEVIHVSTTPLFSFVRTSGSFLGLALCAPLGKNRGNTLPAVPAILLCAFLAWALNLAGENVPTQSATMYFAAHFFLSTVRVPIFLRLLPLLGRKKQGKED